MNINKLKLTGVALATIAWPRRVQQVYEAPHRYV